MRSLWEASSPPTASREDREDEERDFPAEEEEEEDDGETLFRDLFLAPWAEASFLLEGDETQVKILFVVRFIYFSRIVVIPNTFPFLN